MKRLLILLPLLCACASPETYSGLPAKLVAAPLLTWVDGDVEEGTTTLFSVPLLTYRGTRQRPGYEHIETCFGPLLAHQETTVRQIRVVRGEPSGPDCPQDDPLAPPGARGAEPEPPPLTSKEKARRGISVSKPDAGLNRRGARRSTSRQRAAPRSTEEGQTPTARTPRSSGRSKYTRLAPKPAGGEWRGYTLKINTPGQVLDHTYPAKRTELSVLWPLIKLAGERPGRVGFKPDRGAAKVYEVGRESREVRFLPFFSHEKRGSFSQTILWPLLGFGWETTSKGTYLRLFYFLRFKVG